jgi:hypothetical protein
LKAKAVSTPITTTISPQTQEEKESWLDELPGDRAFLFRHAVGKLRFAVEFRPDLLFCTWRVSTFLSHPTVEAWAILKRVLKYVSCTLNKVLHLQLKEQVGKPIIEAFSDSDYAGDHSSRKSVSCGVVRVSEFVINMATKQQSIIATSSCEAEYYSLGSVTVVGLGLVSLFTELGFEEVKLQVLCDSSSARSLAHRTGYGRCKHVDVKLLWLQQVFTDTPEHRRRAELKSVKSEDNLADLGTKAHCSQRLSDLASRVGLQDEGEILMIEDYEETEAQTLEEARQLTSIVLAVFVIGIMSVAYLGMLAVRTCAKLFCSKPVAKSVRHMQVQSPTTYRNGRFTPLAESQHGCWQW